MKEKREKLAAGIALLNAAEMMLEQAGVEFGGEAPNGVNVLLGEAIHAVQNAAVFAVKHYDRTNNAA